MQKNSRFRERNLTHTLFILPGTLLYLIFFIAPILWGIYYSFTDYNGIAKDYQWVGFKNYLGIFQGTRFPKALWFNLRYSVALITIVMVLGLVFATLLNRKLKGRSALRSIYFFPAVLSTLTVGLVFNEIFIRALPWIGEHYNIAFLSANMLSNSKTAIWGVLIVNIWQGLAIPTVLLLTGLQTVPEDLYEAAALDGASAWQRFCSITLPFLLPTISIVFVLLLKDGLTVFDYIMAMTGGGPAGATESMSMLIYNHGFVERKFSFAIAESVMLSILICTISYLQISWSNKRKVY